MFSRDSEARRRINELEERFSKLHRDFQALELEWNNAYDKLAKMMGRVAKRAEILQKEMDGGKPELTPSEIALGANISDLPGGGGMLTPRQRAVNHQILRRRGGLQ